MYGCLVGPNDLVSSWTSIAIPFLADFSSQNKINVAKISHLDLTRQSFINSYEKSSRYIPLTPLHQPNDKSLSNPQHFHLVYLRSHQIPFLEEE
jgi:hypothetical protein